MNGASAKTDQSQRIPRRYTAAGGKDARPESTQKPCPSFSHLQQPSTHLIPTSTTSIRHSRSFHQVSKTPIKYTHSFNQASKPPGATWDRRQQSGDHPLVPPCSGGGTYAPPPPPTWNLWQDLRDGLEQQQHGGPPKDPSERHLTFTGGQQEGCATGGKSCHLVSTNGGLQRPAKARMRYSLYESNSSPEFVVPVMESMQGRTQSYDQLVLAPPSPPSPISPARERIEQVSQAMWESVAGSRACQLEHPLTSTFHSLFLRLCPIVGFTEAQFASVRETSSPSSSPRHACGGRRRCVGGDALGPPVEYRLLGPLLDPDPRVTCQGYCSLLFQASVVNRGSSTDHRQDEESILKVNLFTTPMGKILALKVCYIMYHMQWPCLIFGRRCASPFVVVG